MKLTSLQTPNGLVLALGLIALRHNGSNAAARSAVTVLRHAVCVYKLMCGEGECSLAKLGD